MTPMHDKIAALWPEIILFATTCVVMVLGLSRTREIRRLAAPIAGLGLMLAGLTAAGFVPFLPSPQGDTALPNLPIYGKALVAAVGLLLLLLMAGTPDRDYEASLQRGAGRGGNGGGGVFDPLRSTRAEFYSFFLFSLTGLMLCASADDLIFLFLALELTSLPTYVMVTISTARNRSMEAGVKYFFLGALGAAVFLYGFALIYGGTGSTDLGVIQSVVADGGLNDMTLLGVVLAVVGVCFKIAAVPMHYYTPDVYQGAASPVAAFLAFTPKAAGFFAILLLTASVGWGFAADGGSGHSLPETLRVLLWVIAAVTMTVGNVLAILQSSVKRILAYSSIAHSGYMLVGVVAGPQGPGFADNGVSAVLFYLLCYGVMTTGAFAVLASLERRRADGTLEEADHIDDLRGLWKTRPVLAGVMVLCAFGLLGLPPLLGFLGKVPLFTSGIAAGEVPLVLVLGLNSAIAAYYYLRLVFVPFLERPETAPNAPPVLDTPFGSRRLAGLLAAAGVVVLGVAGGWLGREAEAAGRYRATAAPREPRPHRAPPRNVVPASLPEDRVHE